MIHLPVWAIAVYAPSLVALGAVITALGPVRDRLRNDRAIRHNQRLLDERLRLWHEPPHYRATVKARGPVDVYQRPVSPLLHHREDITGQLLPAQYGTRAEHDRLMSFAHRGALPPASPHIGRPPKLHHDPRWVVRPATPDEDRSWASFTAASEPRQPRERWLRWTAIDLPIVAGLLAALAVVAVLLAAGRAVAYTVQAAYGLTSTLRGRPGPQPVGRHRAPDSDDEPAPPEGEDDGDAPEWTVPTGELAAIVSGWTADEQAGQERAFEQGLAAVLASTARIGAGR